MKPLSFSQVFLVSIISITTITITAITLDFTGAIDISWTEDGLKLRLESEGKTFPAATGDSL